MDGSDFGINETLCLICQSANTAELGTCTDGITKLLEYGKLFEKDTLVTHLEQKQGEGLSVKVHKSCQKYVANQLRKRLAEQDRSDGASKKARMVTRAEIDKFNWKEDCLFCGNKCKKDSKHPGRNSVHQVTYIEYKETILKTCKTRNDTLAQEVEHRVVNCIDLVQEEAQYHNSCRKNFFRENTQSTPFRFRGRPKTSSKQDNFVKLCTWLEGECDPYTLPELYEKMEELSDSDDLYIRHWFKKKLLEKYGDKIFFTEAEGKPDVVCFRDMAGFLINDKWYQGRKDTAEEEAKRIVVQAAKIILGQLRSSKFETDYFPTIENISNIESGKQWLPSYLRTFVETLIKQELKQVSIGQAIVAAVKPRSSVSPIMFGLGVEMDKVFGSKYLLTELNKLGFSISNEEVTRYKQSVVCNEKISDFLKDNLPGSFSQWSADNVDHNTRTLDGKDSLHAMGILVSSTAIGTRTNRDRDLPLIPRQKLIKADQVTAGKGVPIHYYTPPEKRGLSKIILRPMLQLNTPRVLPQDVLMDHIWHVLRFSSIPRPSWSGFMTDVSMGVHPSQANIYMLPIINIDPTNMSCIYSTLKFVENQALELQAGTPVLTFDQPLWLKATEIINAMDMNIVCFLGGFHLLMSFLGSIGSLMKGSGLAEALEQIYGKNTVIHILSGKAVSRSLRSHFLVESALITQMIEKLTQEEMEQEEGEGASITKKKLNSELQILNEQLKTPSDFTFEKIHDLPTLTQLRTDLQNMKRELSSSSRTAHLWIQYLEYIELVKMFIRSERTGNWNLYLYTLTRMLNLFAATGHIYYAKSARLHLQFMLELDVKHPSVHDKFVQGYHTVRRSNRYWGGLWTDLIIEQVMMRALKSSGGITRGRGVSESVQQLWIGSMHRCAGVQNAMAELTGALRKTSEQHIELGASRIKRDNEDMSILSEWFSIHDPFDATDSSLRSLSTGLTASTGDGINCDRAEEVGHKIQKKLDNVSMEDVTFKKKDQVKTLEDLHPSITIENKSVHINPTILFSRLTALASREESVSDQFYYELTPEPTALFKDGMMRKPAKAILRNAMLKMTEPNNQVSANSCVVDGGALLHKVQWLPKSNYGDILNQYSAFVSSRYGKYQDICIVFDGYTDVLSTKVAEQNRRMGLQSASIKIGITVRVTCSREVFLRNTNNKSQLIEMLSSHLLEKGYRTFQSDGDADTAIVKAAISVAEDNNTVVVATDDTDVLLLLMYHWKQRNMATMYFSTEKRDNKVAKLQYWKINELVDAQPHVKQLLFAHAWTGCDTTSAIHQKGKLKILKQLESTEMRKLADIFGNNSASEEKIGSAGLKLMIKSYGGKPSDTLANLRHMKYIEMVAASNDVEPENLPPTERATHFHALRVHLQVAQWMRLDLHCLDVTNWGWKVKQSQLQPIQTDMEPGPEWLLKFVRCKCKSASQNQCKSRTCSCRKNGLVCVEACQGCHGEGCCNTSEPEIPGIEAATTYDDDRNIFDLFEDFLV